MKLTETSIYLVTTWLVLGCAPRIIRAQVPPPNIVESVIPDGAEAGATDLLVTITLLNLGTPPVPPSHVTPVSVSIGSLTGRVIARNGLVVTATFDIPSSETGGLKDVTLTFPGPDNQNIIFTKSSVFDVRGGSEGSDPVDPVDVKSNAGDYVIVDTGQDTFYNNTRAIYAPGSGDPFYGQDAQYQGVQPAYRDNGNGTVTELNTGLMWQKHLPSGKYPYSECVAYADTSTLAGYIDWRLPTIKELYSLILFSGVTGMSESNSVPYLDTRYFDFRFGGEVDGSERFIDAQYASSTLYQGTTMGGNETMFGLNFVDGRIKGYPTFKNFEIKMVRGGNTYGINEFVDNGDGTVTDRATGLMWDKAGSNTGMNWMEALALAEQKNTENYLGYADWRLPNAKELQSIVDYDRSPVYTNSAAISPLFHVPVITDEKGDENYPFYWTSTTHNDGPLPDKAVYLAFGEALGFMNNRWLDVHGAGAQRSDPKDGDPEDYPAYFGPQGDVRRVFNYVRLVRTVATPDDGDNTGGTTVGNRNRVSDFPEAFTLHQNYPNPFNPVTSIRYSLPGEMDVEFSVYNIQGQKVNTLVSGRQPAGSYEVIWDGTNERGAPVASGIYLYQIVSGNQRVVRSMVLLK